MYRKDLQSVEKPSLTGLRPETDRLLLPRGDRGQIPCPRTVVVLGDSIAYGYGLPYAQSYPAQLESLLNREAKDAARWRVINAGVPGDTVMMGCMRYTRDVKPFHPSIVLLAFGLNDAALRRTRFDAQREQLWRAQRYPWARVGAILRRIGRTFLRHGSEVTLCAPGEVRREESSRVSPSLFTKGLSDLIRRAQRQGAKVHLLSLVPASGQGASAAQRDVYRKYDQLIHELVQRYKVPLVDLDDAQSDPFVPETMLAADGIHLTASGQSWLANRVHNHLGEES